MAYKVHDIRIGGVPIFADTYPWRWVWTTNANPGSMKILVPTSREKEFWPALYGNPLDFTIRATHSSPDGTTDINKRIGNLFVVEAVPVRRGSELLSQITVVDTRWWWKFAHLDGRFNHIIRVNDADVAAAGQVINIPSQGSQTVKGTAAPVRPYGEGKELIGFRSADVIGEHVIIPKVAWRDLTINPATGAPFTAYEFVFGILNGYDVTAVTGGTHHVKGILRDGESPATYVASMGGGGDNKFVPPRLDYGGSPAVPFLNKMLALARLRIVTDFNGRVILYDYDLKAEPKLPDGSQVETGAPLFMTDNRGYRPDKVRVPFRAEREIRYYVEQEGAADDHTTVPVSDQKKQIKPTYKPIMRLPGNVRLSIEGEPERLYVAGTIVEMEPVLKSIGFDFKWFQEHFYDGSMFVEALMYKELGLIDPNQIPQSTMNILSAAREAYRRMFQLDPGWIRQLISLSADSALVVDSITGRRSPSRAWVDYTVIRTSRLGFPKVALRDRWQFVGYDRKVAGSAEPADDADAAPFSVEILDQDLALFRINPNSDYHGFMHSLLIGKPKGWRSEAALSMVPETGAEGMHNVILEDDFGCAINLTTVSMEPNTADQFHLVDWEAADFGIAGGGMVDVHTLPMVRDETARFDLEGVLVNEKMVNARARAEALLYYQTIQDRIANTGLSLWAGIHDLLPFGPVNSTGWMMDADGFLYTFVDAIERPGPLRDIDQLLPADLRHERMKLPPSQT